MNRMRAYWQSWSTLQKAFAISLAMHGALLTLRVAAPEQFDRLFNDTPMDVILVNTRAKASAPEKAQALAQTQLAGGGEAKSGRAASPLTASDTSSLGDPTDAVKEQVASLRKEQALLLAQVKNLLAQLPPPPQKAQQSPDENERKRRQLLKLLAEIEERINQDNARPRKHYISPATREVSYALYYSSLRHKIEERGTRYFPVSEGQKLYGELTMIITVNSDGRVLTTEIVKSSGNTALDRRAEAIATAAGPFGAFTEQMRKEADQLAIVSRFIFSRDNALHTRGGEAAN